MLKKNVYANPAAQTCRQLIELIMIIKLPVTVTPD